MGRLGDTTQVWAAHAVQQRGGSTALYEPHCRAMEGQEAWSHAPRGLGHWKQSLSDRMEACIVLSALL